MADAQVVYFHGLPGGAGELALFGADIAAKARAFHIPCRLGSQKGLSAPDYFAGLASDIRKVFPAVPLHLLGFSLGASAALRTAPYLGDQVRQIDLVSPAAPLDLGPYLSDLAGGPVFRIAKASPMLFAVLSTAQGLMARKVPARLFAMLFATAQGADRSLAELAPFRAAMEELLRDALNQGRRGYRQEIQHYVRDWSAELARVDAPVAIFHGEDDNWSPIAMADDLARHLKSCVGLEKLPGHSHYSTLGDYLLRRC